MMRLSESRRGQSLLELVLVLGLASAMVVALVALAVGGVKTNRTARNRARATRLVEEEFAFIEGVRDGMEREVFLVEDGDVNTLWCGGNEDDECYLVDAGGWIRQSGQELVSTEGVDFYRSYSAQRSDPDCGLSDSLGVTLEINWSEPGGTRTMELHKCLASPAEYR